MAMVGGTSLTKKDLVHSAIGTINDNTSVVYLGTLLDCQSELSTHLYCECDNTTV